MSRFLAGKHLKRFEAIQLCLVPRARRFTPEQRQASLCLVDDFIAGKPPLIRFQIFLFMMLVDAVSLFAGLRTFKNLPPRKKIRVMKWFFDCPIALFRKGFWGINTLAKMGVYGQEDFYSEIGYKLREVPHV